MSAMKEREEAIHHFLHVFEWIGIKLIEVYHLCVSDKDDINKQEFSLIGYIGRKEHVIMREIANFLEVPFSTATGIVDKLVQKKYLKRYNPETDRRTVMICLTPKKGKNMFEKYVQKKFELGKLVMEALDEKEQDQLIQILEKVAEQIRQKGAEEWSNSFHTLSEPERE